MKHLVEHFIVPLIASTVLVLPFLVLELVNRRDFKEDFPFVLFGILWLLLVIMLSACQPMVQVIRGKAGLKAIGFFTRIAVMVISAWLWVSIVLDQQPCFLGVLNCD